LVIAVVPTRKFGLLIYIEEIVIEEIVPSGIEK